MVLISGTYSSYLGHFCKYQIESYWLLRVPFISDGTIDLFEDSIEDPTIHECPVGEFPVTYKIVEQGSKRGKVKLIGSNGYTYNIKSRGVNVVYWQCSVRPKEEPCKALVMERNGGFQSNSTCHNHQPAAGAATAAEIMVAVKAEAMRDLFKPVPAIVNEVIC